MLYTFIKPNGAMRNTQNPHIVNFEGVISFSTNTCPAPTISAINDNFKDEIISITNHLNNITEDSITTIEVNSLSEMTEKFSELINNSEPHKLS